MLSTASFGCAILVVMTWLGEKMGESKIAHALASTGQMTLSHYIISLTVGMIILSILTGKNYTGNITAQEPTSPLFIFLYSIIYFLASVAFSVWWKSKFKNRPFEILMRKVST
jgi:uncharacterized protein